MSKSNYLENKDLDHRYGGPDFARPATIYVALWIGDPGEDGSGGAEVTGNGYARPAVTNNATNFPAASGGSKSNGAIIQFPVPAGDWGSTGAKVTHWATFDALSGGNMLDYAPLDTAKVFNAGDDVKIPAGGITFTED